MTKLPHSRSGAHTPQRIFHIVSREDWNPDYRPESLGREGFVHCSSREELVATLEQHFATDIDLFLIEIDPDLLTAELRWEVVPGRGASMAHLYGPINEAAVVAMHELLHDGSQWVLPWSCHD